MANIVQVYHGTPDNFNEFSFEKMGKNSGTSGAGFGMYFTESESEAFSYGPNIFKCTLSLKSNISNDEVTFNKNIIYQILYKLYVNYDENYFENFGIDFFPEIDDYKVGNVFTNFMDYCDSDTEIIGSIVNAGINVSDIFEVLCSLGYDHTIDKHETYGPIGTLHYIIYSLDTITILKKYTLDSRN